jgi:hypothetical protein
VLRPCTPAALASLIADRAADLPAPTRVLVDGVGSRALAAAVGERLVDLGRVPHVVSAGDFLRPAGERLEHGREDPLDLRTRWLDESAVRREVLGGTTWLPALRDRSTDRSVRLERRPVHERGVVVLSGLFLLGRGLPCDLAVHLDLSASALLRRGVPEWQLEAFSAYRSEVAPHEVCDVLVRAEDPLRPAVLER